MLTLLATLIVVGSAIYSHYLSTLLAKTEREKVLIWSAAQKAIVQSSNTEELNLAITISTSNSDIPIIETDEHDHPTGNYRNIDSAAIAADSFYLQQQLNEFKQLHEPIIVKLQDHPLLENKYYYGESLLQKQLRYYPIVELILVSAFLILLVTVQRSRYKSSQNLLWVGMAKETAHQLGTPLSSLEGWIELLKEIPEATAIAPEMAKDIQRLILVTDRFGKIGSTPKLEKKDIIEPVRNMFSYMQKRASGKVSMSISVPPQPLYAMISIQLFDWVIENLLKNALDAMDGSGKIKVEIHAVADNMIHIDISDTGKGIPYSAQKRVFNPGFTTKKRGWGLGLTLTKRIVEEYHKGQIFVQWSEPGNGTTFRIVLPRA